MTATVDRTPLTGPPAAGPPAEPTLRNTVEWSDSLLAHLRELVAHRELLWTITQREIKVRYRQTVFGALWAIVQPLGLMFVFTVFFSRFMGIPSDGLPYPLFAYAALLPWTFFSTALTFAAPSLVVNSHIITRIYFPREIVPLASIAVALVDFAVAAIVFVGMLALYRVPPSWTMLYAVPLLLIQVVFTSALCLLLSGLVVLYRDVRFTLPLLIQVWMFVTPILYPASTIPADLRALYLLLNPLAVVVEGNRQAVLQGQPLDPRYLAGAAGVSLGLLWIAYLQFKRLEKNFADLV